MQEIPITNDGVNMMYVGGRTINPGETRLIPIQDVPHHMRPGVKKSEPPQEKPLELLLQANVETVSNRLPGLSHDELDEIDQLEKLNQARKGVADAISRERLRRADLALLTDETELLIDHGSVEQLQQQKDKVAAHPELVNLIDNRLAILSEEIDAD